MLGSGSAGNATLVSDGGTQVLIDVGLGARETARRLEAVGAAPDAVDAILLTHAHGDHTRGVLPFVKRYGTPVHATAAVRRGLAPTEAVGGEAPGNGPGGGQGDGPAGGSVNRQAGGPARRPADGVAWRPLEAGRALTCGRLRFEPFAVPHDAAETLGFVIGTPEGRIGYATDIGAITPAIADRFHACRLLVIESNHAEELLRMSPYARSTRERIAGRDGHLSNEALAAFVRRDLGASVRCLVLAHLSRVNNLPELADAACRDALAAAGRPDVDVVVTRQDRPAPTIDLAADLPRADHPPEAAAPPEAATPPGVAAPPGPAVRSATVRPRAPAAWPDVRQAALPLPGVHASPERGVAGVERGAAGSERGVAGTASPALRWRAAAADGRGAAGEGAP